MKTKVVDITEGARLQWLKHLDAQIASLEIGQRPSIHYWSGAEAEKKKGNNLKVTIIAFILVIVSFLLGFAVHDVIFTHSIQADPVTRPMVTARM